jgi:hypothetical protein
MAGTAPTITNPYAAPNAELFDSRSDKADTDYFVVSSNKLVVLYIATLGLYQIVWFYSHFKQIKKSTGSSIWPTLRALFPIFFVFGLFKKIHESATATSAKPSWSHASNAALFIVLSIFYNYSDHISDVVGLLSLLIIPILAFILEQVQHTANVHQGDPTAKANNKYTVLNYVCIVIGFSFWVMLLAVYADDLGWISLAEYVAI